MGWWNQDAEGHSLIPEETGLVWGDGPADVMGAALDEIVALFEAVVGRKPTMDELKGGLLFSARSYLEDE